MRFVNVLKSLISNGGKLASKQQGIPEVARKCRLALDFLESRKGSANLDYSKIFQNRSSYKENCEHRGAIDQYNRTLTLIDELTSVLSSSTFVDESRANDLAARIEQSFYWLPNISAPQSPAKLDGNDGRIIFQRCKSKESGMSFEEIALDRGDLYVDTTQSYCIHDDVALLEFALLQYAMDVVIKEGFKPIELPDTVPTSVVEKCGLVQKSSSGSDMIYTIDQSGGVECLAGTAEMGLAQYASTLDLNDSDFPLLAPDLRVMDMPVEDLGLPAYRKYDIESLFPHSLRFGEISSCSNCTDYQSRRLGITYRSKTTGEELYAHTINGTAMAASRVLMTLIEHYYDETRHLMKVPSVLVPYVGKSTILNKKPKGERFFIKLLSNPTGYGAVTYEETLKKRIDGRAIRRTLLQAPKN